MDRLGESSRGSGHVLSGQLGESAAGLDELVLEWENPNPGFVPYIKHIIAPLSLFATHLRSRNPHLVCDPIVEKYEALKKELVKRKLEEVEDSIKKACGSEVYISLDSSLR